MTHRSDSGLVAWVPTAVWPGQLGVCADTRLQTAQDWAALAREGAGLVALLLDEDAPETADLLDHAGEAGLEVVPFSLPRLGWPEDQESFVAYLDELMDALLDGRQVVAVSRLGQEHAGLVVACLLMQAGLPSDAALGMVQRTCGDHVLSAAQGEMVGAFEQLDRASHK